MTRSDFLALYDELLSRNGMGEHLGCGEAFFALTERMLEVNEHLNLTAITEPAAVILRHYIDALTLAPLIPEGAAVADIGSGAGFPALPLCIARPDLRVTAIDGTGKRVRYMAETAELLGLSERFTALTLRAEDGARDPALRGKFDVVTARAVAAMPLLSELSGINGEYRRVSDALSQVRETGYGLVMPETGELTLEEPEIVKQGGQYGVRLRASAPSIHIMCNKPKSLEAA